MHQNERLQVEGKITLHVNNVNLITAMLFTVVKHWCIVVRLGTAFIYENILTILMDEQKVTV